MLSHDSALYALRYATWLDYVSASHMTWHDMSCSVMIGSTGHTTSIHVHVLYYQFVPKTSKDYTLVMGRIDLKTLFGAGSAFSEPMHWNSCHPRVSGIALDVCNEHGKYVPRLIVVETWIPEMDLSDNFPKALAWKHCIFETNHDMTIHVSVFL